MQLNRKSGWFAINRHRDRNLVIPRNAIIIFLLLYIIQSQWNDHRMLFHTISLHNHYLSNFKCKRSVVWKPLCVGNACSTMSTAFMSNRLKCVDAKTKSITYGYIHGIESSLSNKIPEDIKNLCLIFYFEFEQFHECSEELQISSSNEFKNNDIVEQISEGFPWHNVYGQIIIDAQSLNAIYIWTLQFTAMEQSNIKCRWSPSIGILSSDKCLEMKGYCFMGHQHDFYCWETWSQDARASKANQESDSNSHTYGQDKGLHVDDTIKMEFDTKNRTLRFYLNGKDLGIPKYFQLLIPTFFMYKMLEF